MMLDPGSGWSVIVPAKSAAVAKSRLAAAYGRWRPQLARAFAEDTISAVQACERATAVVLVTDDDELRGIAAKFPKVFVVADPGRDDVNVAIRAGAEGLPGPVAAVTADLPALTGTALTTVLDSARDLDAAVIADQEGTGTTLLTGRTACLLRPRFGEGSFAAHKRGGATELVSGVAPALRRDVDLPEQLSDAVTMGIGPATAAVLVRIDSGAGSDSDPAPLK